MAYGFICRNCGYQEAGHKKRDEVEHIRGYHFSLQNCPGFEYRKKDISEAIEIYRDDDQDTRPPFPNSLIVIADALDAQDPEIMRQKEFRLCALHKQGQARSAWGFFAAITSQKMAEREQRDFEDTLRVALSSDEKAKLIEQRKKKLRGLSSVLRIG